MRVAVLNQRVQADYTVVAALKAQQTALAELLYLTRDGNTVQTAQRAYLVLRQLLPYQRLACLLLTEGQSEIQKLCADLGGGVSLRLKHPLPKGHGPEVGDGV